MEGAEIRGAGGTASTGGLDCHIVVDRGQGFTLEVSVAVPPGRTVALLGPNGAGKSTTVAAVAGVLALDSGRIALGGRVLDDGAGIFVPPEQRRIGVVFQDYLLFPHLSVVENVAFGLRSTGIRREMARDRAMEWVDRLGLGELADRRSSGLSGGQAQRVALARALVTEPDLLLLDEPLAALDVTTRTEARRLLSDHLDAYPGPRLLITHDPTEAFLLADSIHVIEEGTITQVGEADDIRLRPRTAYAADLAGVNLVSGQAHGFEVDVGGHIITVAEPIDGPVLLTIRPQAISLHPVAPHGSVRNTWQTSVGHVEHLGERTRVRLGAPLGLTAEITHSAADELRLATGSVVWVAIKATEVAVGAA